VRAKELIRQVLDLLHRTRNAEAAKLAEQAIAADPTDAMSYLYLGAALQELGREGDARAAYDRCVRDATRNGFDQCRALGGRKKR
jgi:Flp pilus assembly protein TadD